MVFTNRLFKRRLTRKGRKAKRRTRKQKGGNILDGRIENSRYAKYGTVTGVMPVDFR
jgi:hypothetical protein